MKFLSTFALLAVLSVFTEASLHDHVHRSNHNSISRRANRDTRRCRQRLPHVDKTDTSITDNKTDVPPKKDDEKKDEPKKDPAPNTDGLIRAQDNRCGPNGATQQVTQTTGPNGSLDWLNCGVEGAGWNPPFVRITDLVTVNLDDAIAQGGPFTQCQPHVWAFKQFGDEFGLPAILLASIALQESSCKPETVGGAGEQGLMQLTHDKCGGAPGGDCKEVGYNVRTGAKYFADTLAANGGNFFLTLGKYNGWGLGMTVEKAKAATNCRAQNNLDYLFQCANGWLLNRDAYDRGMRLGKYFNLDRC